MVLYDGYRGLNPVAHSVVTVGSFDGLHIGHQKILKAMRETEGAVVTVVTFDPHPRTIIDPTYILPLLTTFEERLELFKQSGVDRVVRITFDKEFGRLEPEQFVQEVLLRHVGMEKIYMGLNHRFGNQGRGTLGLLTKLGNELGFGVYPVQPEYVEDVTVSSSRVRRTLAEGDMKLAHRLLGKPYRLTGTVVVGERRGRKIGFPTANIPSPGVGKLIPPSGIYASVTTVGGVQYGSVTHLGERPTFEGSAPSFETHIFDFDRDIYGQPITVGLLERFRATKKYDTVTQLVEQIRVDAEYAKKVYGHYLSLSAGEPGSEKL